MPGPAVNCLPARQYGVLLHVTSLPGGDLGPDAYRWVDFLCAAGAGVWQVLPMVSTHRCGSPYNGQSVYAGEVALISVSDLLKEGLVTDSIAASYFRALGRGTGRGPAFRLLQPEIRQYLHSHRGVTEEMQRFERENDLWLTDYASYRVLKDLHHDAPWHHWPAPLRDRDAAALDAVRAEHADRFEAEVLTQYLFWRQWSRLKRYANNRGVRIMGDLPIFPAHDSAEVWSSRRCFQLDAEGSAIEVAGVPPDYFSATGQRWGNPLYDWRHLAEDGFRWWLDRVRVQLRYFDLVRLDHFRGFESFWAIPAASRDATRGRWQSAPGDALFAALARAGSSTGLIAEDLGSITPAVEAMRRRAGLPGMRVLQFAFDGDPHNPHLPHNHEHFGVVYTGTHDNPTALGWFQALDAEQRARVMAYLGTPAEPMPRALVRSAMASVSRLAVVPMQDVMGLDDASRMNTPGTTEGNWRWRFDWADVPPDAGDWLRRTASTYGRTSSS